jgi:hypothetical protein
VRAIDGGSNGSSVSGSTTAVLCDEVDSGVGEAVTPVSVEPEQADKDNNATKIAEIAVTLFIVYSSY